MCQIIYDRCIYNIYMMWTYYVWPSSTYNVLIVCDKQ